MSGKIDITKKFFEAFSTGNRIYIEKHISSDFTFSSPPDPLLDRAGYFDRCWPHAGQNWDFTFIRALEYRNTVVITYKQKQSAGISQNTEVFTFVGDKVQRIEVYFGWKI